MLQGHTVKELNDGEKKIRASKPCHGKAHAYCHD